MGLCFQNKGFFITNPDQNDKNLRELQSIVKLV